MQEQKIVLAGTAPTFSAPNLTDTAPMGSVLIVKNGSAAAITVTITTPGTLPTGDAFPDKAYTIGAAAERWIPVDQEAYRKADGSNAADLAFSAVASVTAAVIARF